MNQVLALFFKELVESWRNFKLVAFLVVFIIIGVLSPFTALILPDILERVMKDSGIMAEIPEPTALDSYTQFFTNMNQLGLVVFIILFGNILTHEFSRNTLLNLVTKGLKRTNVIIVKSAFMVCTWTLGYVVSALVTYAYTVYYWDEAVNHLFLSFVMTWIYGVFVISLLMLASTLFASSFIAVLLSVVTVVIVMMMVGIHPDLASYLPQYLIGNNIDLLAGRIGAEDILWSSVITVILSLVLFIVALLRFKKMQMT
ncbi:ABC transporter permease [Salinicoccus sesuvii]|uniref:ABC transporter permease n=1 Tax=Salinicoccus sesuvii TaxID=868281 RepID=A0ABV7N446_9STAP